MAVDEASNKGREIALNSEKRHELRSQKRVLFLPKSPPGLFGIIFAKGHKQCGGNPTDWEISVPETPFQCSLFFLLEVSDVPALFAGG